VGHPHVTKMYNEEKLYSGRSLVVVHILNFQRDPVVMRFIHIELIICSTSKVDRVKAHIHVVRDITYNMYMCFNSSQHFILQVLQKRTKHSFEIRYVPADTPNGPQELKPSNAYCSIINSNYYTCRETSWIPLESICLNPYPANVESMVSS